MGVLYLQRDETFFCDEHAPLCVTKTLGVPYLPQGAELPTDDNGDPLRLLFQLNLDECEPTECLPETGILQIFVSDTVEDSDNYDRSAVCVRFYDHVDYDTEEPEGLFLAEADNAFGLMECRYEEGDGDDGLTVGGELDLYELSADAFDVVEHYPEYGYPLLCISAEEQPYSNGGRVCYFLVDEQELKTRDIHRVTVLFDEI